MIDLKSFSTSPTAAFEPSVFFPTISPTPCAQYTSSKTVNLSLVPVDPHKLFFFGPGPRLGIDHKPNVSDIADIPSTILDYMDTLPTVSSLLCGFDLNSCSQPKGGTPLAQGPATTLTGLTQLTLGNIPQPAMNPPTTPKHATDSASLQQSQGKIQPNSAQEVTAPLTLPPSPQPVLPSQTPQSPGPTLQDVASALLTSPPPPTPPEIKQPSASIQESQSELQFFAVSGDIQVGIEQDSASALLPITESITSVPSKAQPDVQAQPLQTSQSSDFDYNAPPDQAKPATAAFPLSTTENPVPSISQSDVQNLAMQADHSSNIYPHAPLDRGKSAVSNNVNIIAATPGPSPGATTINGIPVIIPTSESVMVVGSSTFAINAPQTLGTNLGIVFPSATENQLLDNGGTISVAGSPFAYQISGSAVAFGSSRTLNPGGTVTIDNTPIELPISGSSIVVGGSTIVLNPTPILTSPPTTVAPIVIQGQTLNPGGVITVSNTPISLPTSGSVLIIGSKSTIPFGAAETLSVGPQALVISHEGSSSDFVVDGHTIEPGSQAIISGVTVSEPTQARDLVIDATTTAQLGGAILSALGYAPSATSGGEASTGIGNGITGSTTFTGASLSMYYYRGWWSTLWLEIILGGGFLYIVAWL